MMKRQHDIEGQFFLYPTKDSGRQRPVFSGYRPVHKLYENYLSSGRHEYPDVEKVMPGDTVKVLAWFISPEVYPGSLWAGRELEVMEGPARVTGKLTVTKVLNAVLAGSPDTCAALWAEVQSG